MKFPYFYECSRNFWDVVKKGLSHVGKGATNGRMGMPLSRGIKSGCGQVLAKGTRDGRAVRSACKFGAHSDR